MKSDLINVILISILSGVISSVFHSSNYYIMTYLHFVIGNFILLFTWAILIKYIEKRKLVLVIGYFSAALYSIFIVVFRMKREVPELSLPKLTIEISVEYIIWTFFFWIGLLIFDNVLRINSTTTKT